MLAPVFNFLNIRGQNGIVDCFLIQSNLPCTKFRTLNDSMLQGLP
jgi:hypothetical protein